MGEGAGGGEVSRAARAVREVASEPWEGSAAQAEVDRVEALGDEICRLAAHIDAAERELLALVAEFDRARGWEGGGHRDCAQWLSVRAGRSLPVAREQVRVARALEALPRTGEAMGRGRLSSCQVRTLTRVADADTEAELLELAEGATITQLMRMARAWKKGTRQDEAARERERHRRRRLVMFPDDGMEEIHGSLTPEVGAVLRRALEAATDALYRRERAEEEESPTRPLTARQRRRQAARRRADAVGLVAERALAAGFTGEDAPISGTRAERFQVFLLVDRQTLATDGEDGRSELEDGTRLAPETARRLACDASVVRVLRGTGGEVLDVGRKSRTVTTPIRRALEVRDRGCRFPGCGLRFTASHHIWHWTDGGPTSLENTVLLCRHHHRLVHEGGWRVEFWGKHRAAFVDPRGNLHLDERPPPPKVPDEPARALVRENRRRGVDPGPLDLGARWTSEWDIPTDLYLRALEAGFAARPPP